MAELRRKCTCLLPMALGVLFVLAGCCHERTVAIVNVKNVGRKILTRYRYRVVKFHELKDWLSGTGADYEGLKVYQPDVFSDDGIPVVIKDDYHSHKSKRWRFPDGAAQEFLCLLYELPTGFTLPCNFREEESSDSYAMELIGTEGGGYAKASFDLYYAKDEVVSFISPFAWLFYIYGNNAPDRFEGGVKFQHDSWTVFSHGGAVDYEAKAYGLAVKLKELEDSGRITDANLRLAKEVYARRSLARSQIRERNRIDENARPRQLVGRQQSQERQKAVTINPPTPKPSYRIISLEREKSVDFAYTFSLEMSEDPSIEAFFAIQTAFARKVLDAYKEEYPSVDVSTLRVYVLPQLVNGRIEGRAAVLTIAPVSLSYDANTRRGRLSVRFNDGQYEEAREWIRKNIETLARDKNIALVTGQLPPAATYYSLGEKVDGNVMEIEFKTE